MKVFGVSANIVALSGIAIAIGTMVDMGIVVCENILKHISNASPDEDRLTVVFRATSEVGGAVLTAVSTTIVSFLPVFTMIAAEGKLFKPLAFTKTFALLASVIVALTMIPTFALILFTGKIKSETLKRIVHVFIIILGIIIAAAFTWWIGLIVICIGVYHLAANLLPNRIDQWVVRGTNIAAIGIVVIILSEHWLPLGPEKGGIRNVIFVAVLIGGLLGFFSLFKLVYGRLLSWCLDHKSLLLILPVILVFIGGSVWLGFGTLTGRMPTIIKDTGPFVYMDKTFPGLGKEFMPPLDEGSYLYMPTSMPHVSLGEMIDIIGKQDMAIGAIPEVESVVGKLGRADSPLDPAPISMIETVINYKPEYIVDANGNRLRFRGHQSEKDLFRGEDGTPIHAPDGNPYYVQGLYTRDENNKLIIDPHGKPFRLWRPPLDPNLNPGRKPWDGIQRPDDIWDIIIKEAEVPGVTSAPRLQPIAARIVMLQSGMRAPMGIKIKGPDLQTIETVGMNIERLLKDVPMVDPSFVIADRIVGKPYLEIHIDRDMISRYGIKLVQVQNVIETAIGGKRITTTVEGRERYPVRVRYLREFRDSIEELERILVPAPDGSQIPLAQLAEVEYKRGPMVIKSEDTFLIGYVLFDKKAGFAEVDVVEQAIEYLSQKIENGDLVLPAGVSYTFAGSYENQIRAQKKLAIVLPLALFIIFIILYLNFGSISTTLLVFSGIILAWSGGFFMVWCYNQPWFLDFSVFGTNIRELFQVHPINLSVAVWVGFLALFGIASDDGVIMATYLDEVFKRDKPKTVKEIHKATLEAAKRRIRPCLMTTATTILALIPVLTSTGRGSDIMVPMAIPSFGGMTVEILTLLVVPVLYSAIYTIKMRYFATKALRHEEKND